MTTDKSDEAQHCFIFQALNPDQGASVLEAVFRTGALQELRALLGPRAEFDAELHDLYYPSVAETAIIAERFGAAFDPGGHKVRLHNIECRGRLPYLFHSGYELPLLLDGTKSFGFEEHIYPPYRHEQEDLFDRHVATGSLYKEECLEPFDPPLRKKDGRIIEGFRRVYYTRTGQEWRVRASKLLWSTADKHRWDERCERIQSMLFGYEDWQTEWWLADNRKRGGGWNGWPIYCSVTDAQLASIEAVGFRAFPPVAGVPLAFVVCINCPSASETVQLMGDAAALVRASISGPLTTDLLKGQDGPNYVVAVEHIPTLNQTINGFIESIARRDRIVTIDKGRGPTPGSVCADEGVDSRPSATIMM